MLLLLAVGGVCFKLGQLSGISIVDKERPFSYAVQFSVVVAAGLLLFVVVVAVGCCVVVVVVVVGGGGVCFKLGQLSGISIVDKERPFSYAAVLLLLLLLQLLLLLLLLLLFLLAAVVVCVLN